MARFTKYNNPNKRRVNRRKDYNDLMVDKINDSLIDKKLGYDIPIEYYKEGGKNEKI